MIFIFIIYSFVLFLLLKKLNFFETSAFRGWGMYLTFGVKLLVALLLYYFPYDTMIDSQAYMHDSEVFSRVIYSHPGDFLRLFLGFGDVQQLNELHLSETTYWSHDKGWMFSDTRNVIRINTIFQWLSFHNPLVILLFNTVVALFGLKLIFLGMQKVTNYRPNLLFILLFFLPSTLLWTANIMKENYMLLGLGLVLYLWFNDKKNATTNIGIAIGFLILLLFKPYVSVALFLFWFLFKVGTIQSLHWRWIAYSITVLVGVFGIFLLCNKVAHFISKKQHDFIQLSEGGLWLKYENGLARVIDLDQSKVIVYEHNDQNFYAQFSDTLRAEYRVHGQAMHQVELHPNDGDWYVYHNLPKSGSHIPITPIHNRWQQLIKNIPQALVNVFLRPYPNDPPKSKIKWYFVLENLVIWAIIVWGLWGFRKAKLKPLAFALFGAALLIALFIGWTTPVLGAIVRYKLPTTLLFFGASWLLLCPSSTKN